MSLFEAKVLLWSKSQIGLDKALLILSNNFPEIYSEYVIAERGLCNKSIEEKIITLRMCIN